jgi:glycosyltransferase 2 family protein
MWRKPQVWIGIIVSLIALFIAFSSVKWEEVQKNLASAQYIWLIPSAVSLIVAIWMRGERWRWLFGDQRDNLPRSRYFNATAIGYLVTNIFPLRLGELARLFFIARDKKQTYGMAASTIVVEHVLDVLVVLGIMLVIIMTGSLPVPPETQRGAVILGVLFGGALVVMLIMVWQRRLVLRLTEAVLSKIPRLNTQKWVSVVEHILDGFAVLQPGLPLVMVLFWSIVGWLCSALTFYLSLKAFVPDAPFSYALFTTVVTTFVLLLPATPGSIGTLQVGIQESLAVLGVSRDVGLSFAIVFHVMELIVMDLLGVICLLREAGSWAAAKESLRSATSQAQPQVESTAAVSSEEA